MVHSTIFTISSTLVKLACMGDHQMRPMRLYGRKQCAKSQIPAGEQNGRCRSAHANLCSLVPVLALGFDALNTRVEAQTQQAATQQEKLKVCEACTAVSPRHLNVALGTQKAIRDA